MTDDDFRRLEGKVDKLTDAVTRLILIEERQTTQGERINKCETQIAVHDSAIGKIDKALHMWVNRGIGVWMTVGAVMAVIQFLRA